MPCFRQGASQALLILCNSEVLLCCCACMHVWQHMFCQNANECCHGQWQHWSFSRCPKSGYSKLVMKVSLLSLLLPPSLVPCMCMDTLCNKTDVFLNTVQDCPVLCMIMSGCHGASSCCFVLRLLCAVAKVNVACYVLPACPCNAEGHAGFAMRLLLHHLTMI